MVHCSVCNVTFLPVLGAIIIINIIIIVIIIIIILIILFFQVFRGRPAITFLRFRVAPAAIQPRRAHPCACR